MGDGKAVRLVFTSIPGALSEYLTVHNGMYISVNSCDVGEGFWRKSYASPFTIACKFYSESSKSSVRSASNSVDSADVHLVQSGLVAVVLRVVGDIFGHRRSPYHSHNYPCLYTPPVNFNKKEWQCRRSPHPRNSNFSSSEVYPIIRLKGHLYEYGTESHCVGGFAVDRHWPVAAGREASFVAGKPTPVTDPPLLRKARLSNACARSRL